jgi:cobyrinic acid a,c-diamide synthase
LLVSAPSSGSGKTSVTAAIARWHARQGLKVRVFKTGPDYLDPLLLERASGAPVYQLDLFMGGLRHCRALLSRAAAEADLILVEGVMGLFDGNPSSADLAAAFGLPVLAVIDASAMAQTFAALATGLQRFRADVRVTGVVANRVAGEAHGRMVAEGLPPDLPLLAALPRRPDLSLPERHLGLVQASELADLDEKLDAWADAWSAARQPFDIAPVAFADETEPAPPPLLQGRRIAVAQDDAFSFVYRANLDCLRALGATVLTFAPVKGEPLPGCDALWLPGGYPELHAAALQPLFPALAAHLQAGKPLLAECGGMLALLDELTDADGHTHAMAGLMPGSARVGKKLAALGLQAIAWPRCPTGREIRGHSFHYSTLETPLKIQVSASNPNAGRTAEALYDLGSLRASYVHHYFPSNPEAIAAFFSADPCKSNNLPSTANA